MHLLQILYGCEKSPIRYNSCFISLFEWLWFKYELMTKCQLLDQKGKCAFCHRRRVFFDDQGQKSEKSKQHLAQRLNSDCFRSSCQPNAFPSLKRHFLWTGCTVIIAPWHNAQTVPSWKDRKLLLSRHRGRRNVRARSAGHASLLAAGTRWRMKFKVCLASQHPVSVDGDCVLF